MKLLIINKIIMGLFESDSDIQTQLKMSPSSPYSVIELKDKTQDFLDFMAYREWGFYGGYNLKRCADWFSDFCPSEDKVHYREQYGKKYVFTKKYFAEVTKLF